MSGEQDPALGLIVVTGLDLACVAETAFDNRLFLYGNSGCSQMNWL